MLTIEREVKFEPRIVCFGFEPLLSTKMEKKYPSVIYALDCTGQAVQGKNDRNIRTVVIKVQATLIQCKVHKKCDPSFAPSSTAHDIGNVKDLFRFLGGGEKKIAQTVVHLFTLSFET